MGFRKKLIDFPETMITFPNIGKFSKEYAGRTARVYVSGGVIYVGGTEMKSSSPEAKYLIKTLRIRF